MIFADLSITTNFTFLTGASHPEEMVERAAALGLGAIAITDRNSLAGVVRAYARLKALKKEAVSVKRGVTYEDVRARAKALAGKVGTDFPSANAPKLKAKSIRVRKDPSGRQDAPDPPEPNADTDFVPLSIPKLIVGARLVLTDSDHPELEARSASERESQQSKVDWIALPKDRAAYGRLTRLLSIGKRRAAKGQCILHRPDIYEWGTGMILIALPHNPFKAPIDQIAAMARRFPGHVYTGAAPQYDGRDAARFAVLAECAEAVNAPLIATSDAMMHHARRRRLADVLTCLRQGCTIDQLGAQALLNAERRLRSPAEMVRLFLDHPEAIHRTAEIAERCTFCLSQLQYEYPDEVTNGEDPQIRLTRLTEEGLSWRYPEGPSEKVRKTVAKELSLIKDLNYARYFLTVRDIVHFARSQGILCQGRGSAANSVVCYALRITEASPETISGVFERFVSKARGEPPDIDVDFEHERREEVIQHIYQRYGRERAGLCATVIHFRARAAMREVGKAMGLSADIISALASQVWGWSSDGISEKHVREMGLDPTDRRLRQTMELVHEIIGFPRHLSQHVGGFVITRARLDEYVPIENASMEDRTVIEWDKDDIEALGMMKVDVLALGMLTCMRKGLDLLREHVGVDHTLATIPQEDARVYGMLQRGDSLGVFQVESRAQMNFLPRMRPRTFYDLVIQVAIVRPGPIQGDMVHPYLRRRRGEEKIDYARPELETILKKTLGVPLFQEQAMEIAMVAAKFTPDEADGLRRAMATFRKTGTIQNYGQIFIERMTQRGYPREFAERVFKQIEGFGEYGFPESHAASFALLVYTSSWLKCHYPAVFACALLNAQPLGFYAPAQIVRDAREHDVEVRPICINASHWDCTLEHCEDGALALRLGFRQIKGVAERDAHQIIARRGNGYRDLESVWRIAEVHPRLITRLAEADAFASLGYSRRRALWDAKAILSPRQLPLFAGDMDGEGIVEPSIDLPLTTRGEEVVEDYVATRLSLKDHPISLLRPQLGARVKDAAFQQTAPDGTAMTLAGLVITRQKPGTASGVIFLTLEDETGVANVVVWPKTFERFRRAVMAGRLLRVTGKLQTEGEPPHKVTHLIAWRIEDLSGMLDTLSDVSDRAGAIDVSNVRADEAKRPVLNRKPTSPHRTKHRPRAMHPREQAKTLFPSRDFH